VKIYTKEGCGKRFEDERVVRVVPRAAIGDWLRRGTPSLAFRKANRGAPTRRAISPSRFRAIDPVCLLFMQVMHTTLESNIAAVT
jgi:hypothetical protein